MEKNYSCDQTLFWMVTSCGLVSAFIPLLVQMVQQIITRETEMEANLRRQVCDLKAELGSISMVDEFPKYAKIQRKVNKVTDELAHQSQMRTSYTLKVRLVATAALYAIMLLATLTLIWNYSSVPVIVLPEEWVYPIGFLLEIPSGVSGGIGLTTWLFVTGTFGRIMVKAVF